MEAEVRETHAEYLAWNSKRFKEIEHLRDRVKFEGSGYAHARYTVTLDAETCKLTRRELMVLCDQGSACFGGDVCWLGNKASVEIYTD